MARPKIDRVIVPTLGEILRAFACLGLTAFGGPAVHIAMMEREFVERRKWITSARFAQLLAIVNLIPGPNSTELALCIGRDLGRLRGMFAAGIAFIFPAVLITAAAAWAYVKYSHLPAVTSILYGMKPAMAAIIAAAVWSVSKTAFPSAGLLALGISCAILALVGISEFAIIFGAGLAWMGIARRMKRITFRGESLTVFLVIGAICIPALAFAVPTEWWQIMGIVSSSPRSAAQGEQATLLRLAVGFTKIGAMLYGSGYVLFAYVEHEFVGAGLLNRAQLLDAIAAGQLTPGPVFSSVVFLGWQMNGPLGALAATFAVFTPSFIYVASLHGLFDRLRKAPVFGVFLQGVNAAAVAAVAGVAVKMAGAAVLDLKTLGIGCASLLVALVFPRVNSAVILAAAGIAGFVLG